jgi:hypothetical protein
LGNSSAITTEEATQPHSEVIQGLGSNNYQWQRLIGSTWTDIPGANSPEYTVYGSEYGVGEQQFRLAVSQDVNCGEVSGPVTLTITD